VKASKLIEHLQSVVEKFGDQPVFLEAESEGRRTHQAVCDVLANGAEFILVSKEAMDADPINNLLDELPAYTPDGIRMLIPKAPSKSE